jgi:ribosome-associated protein
VAAGPGAAPAAAVMDEPAAEPAETGTQIEPGDLAHRIVEVASDKKAGDVVMLRTAEVTTMADYFVICSGRSDRQVQVLAGAIVDELRKEGIRPLGIEGKGAARWVLLDYGSVIVHVFAPEEREFYGLERLWSTATQVVRVV